MFNWIRSRFALEKVGIPYLHDIILTLTRPAATIRESVKLFR